MLTKYALTRYFAEWTWSEARPDCVVRAVLRQHGSWVRHDFDTRAMQNDENQ
jgi:hypothetical protein